MTGGPGPGGPVRPGRTGGRPDRAHLPQEGVIRPTARTVAAVP